MPTDDLDSVVLDTASRLLADLAASRMPIAARWAAVEEAGLPLTLAGEESGGIALGGRTGAAIVRGAARAGVDLPIGEAMVARLLMGRRGTPLPDGLVTLGWDEALVPFGAEAAAVLVERNDELLLLTPREVRPHQTLGGSPRAEISGDARSLGSIATGTLLRCGAALRTIQLAGAADAILALTVAHVTTREQFGRPLAKFQAIQQELARLGTQVAVLDGAAGIAADFLDGDLGPSLALPAAKARAAEAAGVVAAIAHQAHGAIGFTDEYRLGHLTKALWSWRAEAGGTAYWQDEVGLAARAAGADALWALVTAA